jgi:ABC-type glycerol-3-phosphate transport system substrate-binding protein
MPTVQQLFAAQVAAAAKEASVHVSLATAPIPTVASQLKQAIAAGQPPDVGLVGSNDSAPLAARGLLRELRDTFDRVTGVDGDLFPPLNKLASAGAFVDLAPNTKAAIWAIPYLSVGGAWLARKDVLAQKGLKPPTTFDEAVAAVAKLTDPATDLKGWGAPLPRTEGVDNLVQTTFLAMGASLFDPQGLRSVVNPDDAAAALQALFGLYRSPDGLNLAPVGITDWSDAQARASFAAGRLGMTVDYGGSYAALVETAPRLRDLIVAFPPPAGPKGWYTAAATSLFVVFKQSPAADRAAAFVERLLQPGRYDAITRAGQGSVVPPYAYLTKNPFWDDDPNYPIFAANARGDPARGFQFATPGEPAPLTLPVAEVRSALVLATAARDVVTGQQTSASAAEALRASCLALAHESFAFQPSPSPTPEPPWLQLLRRAVPVSK